MSELFLPDTAPERALSTRVRKFRGKLFVANAKLGYELDEVAEFIFKRIDGVASVREIGAAVAKEYEVAEDEALVDTIELLTKLADDDLISVRG